MDKLIHPYRYITVPIVNFFPSDLQIHPSSPCLMIRLAFFFAADMCAAVLVEGSEETVKGLAEGLFLFLTTFSFLSPAACSTPGRAYLPGRFHHSSVG